MAKNRIVKIVAPNINGKAIVDVNGDIYVIPALGFYKGQEIVIDIESAVYFPSMLYAMATLYNNDFSAAVEFIKENF